MSEKIQPTEQARKLIADASAEFLKTRMQITREILLSNYPLTITLDEYVSGITQAEDENTYREEFSARILVSDQEIEELVSLVKESLIKYSIGNVAWSGRFSHLVSDALSNLEKNINQDESLEVEQKLSKLENIRKWMTTVYGICKFGIDPRIVGEVSWRYFDEFRISDSKNHLFCKIGLDGIDKMALENRKREDEDILLANALFLGEIHKPGKTFAAILYHKANTETAKIVGANMSYPLSKQNDCEEYAEFILSFKDFLEFNGLSCLIEDLYDESMILRIIEACYNKFKLSEEEKENREKLIAPAVEWWVNAITNPKFDNGDIEAGLLASNLNAMTKKAQDEEIQKFKEYLADEIRIGLLVSPNWFQLRVDYHPDMYLARAANKAKLNANFPWKTTMTITGDKVSVRLGYGASEEVIYDANQNSFKI